MQAIATAPAPTLTRIARLSGRPAGAAIYAALREAIISAELEPGRQLSENELAAQLGVSRTPIREALARLRDDRLVEIVPQLGTFVSHISEDAVGDAQFMREALECSAVRLAAERADDDEIAALRGIVQRQQAARDARDLEGFLRLDDELHETLCAISGHAVAWTVVQRVNAHLKRIRRLSVPQRDYIGKMVAEHEEVVEAVARGDADAAEAALRHHLRMVLSGLPAIRAEHPEYFEGG